MGSYKCPAYNVNGSLHSFPRVKAKFQLKRNEITELFLDRTDDPLDENHTITNEPPL